MAIETISFSRRANEGRGGWSSFHSFYPDWMVSMNSNLYTFKNGELYLHHDNATRNAYYVDLGTREYLTYNSEMTFVFNDDPSIKKSFRTIELDSTSTWQADCTTDLNTGIIETDYYKLKEGDYFSYIRRDPNTIDTRALSTQGIGYMSTTYAADTATFGFNIDASFSIGDKLYVSDGATLSLVGTITSSTATTITVDATTTTPGLGELLVVIKNSTAESYDPRGYYMEVKLTNTEDTSVELFSVSTDSSQSLP
jgi:hypothetical protein